MINLDLKSLIERMNPQLKTSLDGAAGLCMSRSQYSVEIEHWLLKILEADNTDIRVLLEKYEINIGKLQKEITATVDKFKNGNTRAPSLSPTLIDAAKNAWMVASVDFGHTLTTSGHLLTALLADNETRAQLVSASKEFERIKPDSIREFAPSIVGTTEESAQTAYAGTEAAAPGDTSGKPSSSPALDKYTIDLTARAKAGEIDPVLGRDQEIRQIIDILTRRRQNNPIMTGEAGVGKTAVVEGFALRIAADDVPDPLKNVAIRTLDLGLLQAGASVKGEFENRLKAVISEVKASPQPIILFIDEAHTLIGAGGKEGQGDAANLLKPALARGELRTLAATTWAEYKKYFERDPALTRRFQVVKIDEPDEDTAIKMMRGISKSLQKHHKVRILDEAIVSSVKLSHRFIPGRQLPDKSVSLLDTACARVALGQSTTPALIEDLNRLKLETGETIKALGTENASTGIFDEKLKELNEQQIETADSLEKLNTQWQTEKDLIAQINEIRDTLETSFAAEKDAPAASTEDKSTAEEAKEGDVENAEVAPKTLTPEEREEHRTKLAAVTKELTDLQGESPLMQPAVGAEAIAEVISNWTGIPMGKMVRDEVEAILGLKELLHKRIIGQSHALAAIAQNIKTSRAGLTDPRKPIGVFLMVGSSGVGKTETALALADTLYGGEHNVTTINMSEFKEEHKVSMLLGSPPGYVGYGEGGVLTEAVRRNPYSIVLLDEMEKAHPGIQDVFYNLFDKGTIKDGEGRDIDFKNTIIIMTSNAGEKVLRKIVSDSDGDLTPDELMDKFRPELLKSFKAPFLGRTQIIPYFPLKDDELKKICAINMRRIEKRLRGHYDADFSYDEAVLDQIVGRCKEVDTGARNIENILSQTMLPELASICLTRMGEEQDINKVHIAVTDDGQFDYIVS